MRNCLTYAMGQWLRHGGYVKMRKSLIARLHGVGPFHPFHLVPHFLHEGVDGRVTQLTRTPEEEASALAKGPWRDWMWLWHFQGRVVEGDEHFLNTEPYPGKTLATWAAILLAILGLLTL